MHSIIIPKNFLNIQKVQENILNLLGETGFKTNSFEDFVDVGHKAFTLAYLLYFNSLYTDNWKAKAVEAIMNLVNSTSLKEATPDYLEKKEVFLSKMMEILETI